jgi:protein-disulfide isomerase
MKYETRMHKEAARNRAAPVRKEGLVLILLLCAVGTARAQQKAGPVAQSPAASAGQSAISGSQAVEILKELRQIRQLLEKQPLPSKQAMAQQLVAPAPPEMVQLSVASNWHVMGRADAPVTLLEFTDYQCPFCKRFHEQTYAALKKDYIETGKVRFVSRDLPLEFHPYALKAAQAARCAGDQQKYWELRDALLANTSAWSDQLIPKEAEKLSLDMKEFQTCMGSEKYKAEVQKDAKEAADLQINGTPTLVLARSAKERLDGVRILGAQPFSSLQSAIDALLKQ